MDAVDAWQALVFGVVEGLTEFLPVSSTGHLIIVAQLLKRDGAATDVSIIVIQLGAILAVCWHYRLRLISILRGLHQRSIQHFIARLLVAFVPAAAVGLAFHGSIKKYLFSPLTVAIALVLGGIAIIIIEQRPLPNRINKLDAMSYRDALWVGIAQILALFPGVSRAAATIMGGRLTGLSRSVATEFSFFLAIPVMFAATALDLLQSWDELTIDDGVFIALGFATAFVSALFAVRWLLAYVATHDFQPFGWYRIAIGLGILSAYVLTG